MNEATKKQQVGLRQLKSKGRAGREHGYRGAERGLGALGNSSSWEDSMRRAQCAWKRAGMCHLKNDCTTVLLDKRKKSCSDSSRNSIRETKMMLRWLRWNKACNSSHGRKLNYYKIQTLNVQKKLGKNDRKKAIPDIQQCFDSSLPSCRQHWEVWNNMHLFHLKGNITFIFNTLLNNVQNHCNFIKLIKMANKNQSRRVRWQITHSLTIVKLSLRNFRKL